MLVDQKVLLRLFCYTAAARPLDRQMCTTDQVPRFLVRFRRGLQEYLHFPNQWMIDMIRC